MVEYVMSFSNIENIFKKWSSMSWIPIFVEITVIYHHSNFNLPKIHCRVIR